MSELELLLRASITIEAQKKRIAALEAENKDLRRELGKWKLLTDMKEDTCALLRRQAE
jgi:hypothetical protein